MIVSMNTFTQGSLVSVLCYGGEVLTRRVVSDDGHTVTVCSEIAYQHAQSKNRKPNGIGFPKTAVREYNKIEVDETTHQN